MLKPSARKSSYELFLPPDENHNMAKTVINVIKKVIREIRKTLRIFLALL
jgi:hypothetical protein